MSRERTFATVASIIFAVGIGANIAVFSVVDRLLFRPLPFTDAHRLLQVHLFANGIDAPITAAMMPHEITDTLRQNASSFDGLAYEGGWVDATVPTPGENPLLLTPVSANALDVLGVSPFLGRAFDPADEEAGRDIAVLLGYETWRNRFGGAADVIGRTWGGNKRRYRIVGVLPRGFFFPSSQLVEHSHGLSILKPEIVADRLTIAPVARLAEGATIEAAQAEADLLARRQDWRNASLRRSAAAGGLKLTVQPLRDGLTMIVGPYMWLTSSAVWIVLAVACVNMSTLLLMRGHWRQQEAAVRAALGASPARLIRLACVHAMALCVAGAFLGWLVYFWVAKWILGVMPPILRGLAATPLDGRLVGFTMLVAAATALAAAAAPAVALGRTDPIDLLRGDLPVRRGRWPLSGGGLLLSIEAVFGVVIAVGAAIMVPDFVRHLLEPTGFREGDLFTVSVNHDWPGGSGSPQLRAERHRTILDVLHALPKAQQAAAALPMPFVDFPAISPFWQSRGAAGRQFAVGPGLFETLQAPLRAGREFSPDDPVDAVAMVNETGARVLWPGVPLRSVPGRAIETRAGSKTIVGVVRDIRGHPGAPSHPDLFLPILASAAEPLQTGLPVLVRMAPGAIPDGGWLAARLNERFPRNAVLIASVADQLAPFVVRPRFLALLFGGVAAVALLLVGVGVYAVASVESARRRRETAIHIALGASPSQARRMILVEVLSPVLVGTAVGLGLAWTAVRTLESLIKELTSAEPLAYGVAALLMLGIATAAALSSHARVSKSEPWTELRSS